MIRHRSLLPTPRRRLAALLVCALALASLALANGALADGGLVGAAALSSDPGAKQSDSATLEQCLTAATDAERSATFTGEMSAIPGSTKMQMRIDVLERMPGELVFHTVTAPGLGVWRSAAPGVKVYKYLKQVTNLSAPASYRAAVRFRWLNAKGRLLKSAELRTPKCDQPLAAPTETTPTEPAPTQAGSTALDG